MGKRVTVTLWEDTWQAVQAVQKAHDEWLALAAVDDPDLQGEAFRWTVDDVINVALREHCPTMTANFNATADYLRKERAEKAKAE